MAEKRGIVGGIALVFIGLWFLVGNLGFEFPGLWELWPLFPLFGGLALMATYFTGRRDDPGVLFPGCAGAMVGVLFLAITVGPLHWDDLETWWPVFPVIGGIAFLTMFAFSRPREAGLLVPGCGGLLVGLFFFLFTLGPLVWDDMGRLWPAFPLIAGVTFLGTWLAERRNVALLVPAGLGILVGLVAFAFTLGGRGVRWLVATWPLVLIVVGLGLVLRSILRGK